MADFGSNNAWQDRGRWWRADETNLLFISSAEATSVLTDATLIGTVQPQYFWTFLSDSETGHKCRVYPPDMLTDSQLKSGRLFLSKQHGVLHQ